MTTKEFLISKLINSVMTILIIVGAGLWLNYTIQNYIEDKQQKNIDEIVRLEERVSELHRFIDTNLVQAGHKVITEKQLKKELAVILKENKELRNYIKDNNEELRRFIKAEFTFNNQLGVGKGEITRPNNSDNYVFDDKYINFNANLKTLEAKYSIKLSNIPLQLNIIQTELPDGKFKLNDYIVIKRLDNGEELKINNAIVQEVYQKDKKWYYGITTLIGVDYDRSLNANLGVSYISSGRTVLPKDTEYRIGIVGVSGNKENIGIFLVPATWNLAQVIPIIQEAQIGPIVKYEFTEQKTLFGIGLLHNF